jgi:hypothetical protein
MPGQYTSNTLALQKRLELIKATIQAGAFSDALAAGLNAGMALMKRRIFNQSLDANGQTLGPYFSEQYARDRRRHGRQTARKDLEYDGTVRRSIEVVTVNNKRAEIRFTNDQTAKIGRYQEQQIFNLRANRPANEASGGRVPIFELSPQEKAVVQSTTQSLLAQKFANI